MILLDTNVVAELMRPHPDAKVEGWANDQAPLSVWITSITVLEVRAGILMLPSGKKRDQLNARFDLTLSKVIGRRVLAFDFDAAEKAAEIYALLRRTGRNVGIDDTQIAAIARSRNATLVTRNVRHFADLDIPLVNPWDL